MTDEHFLARIRETPGDRTVQMVYADWLDERGRHWEAAVRRADIRAVVSRDTQDITDVDGNVFRSPALLSVRGEADALPEPPPTRWGETARCLFMSLDGGRCYGEPWLVMDARVAAWHPGGRTTFAGTGPPLSPFGSRSPLDSLQIDHAYRAALYFPPAGSR